MATEAVGLEHAELIVVMTCDEVRIQVWRELEVGPAEPIHARQAVFASAPPPSKRRSRHAIAGSAAAIALVAATSSDDQVRNLIQFDLDQATMSGMLAAADLGIGIAHAGVHDQELTRRLLCFPRTTSVPCDHPSARPPTAPLTPIQQPVQRRRAPRPLVAARRPRLATLGRLDRWRVRYEGQPWHGRLGCGSNLTGTTNIGPALPKPTTMPRARAVGHGDLHRKPPSPPNSCQLHDGAGGLGRRQACRI